MRSSLANSGPRWATFDLWRWTESLWIRGGCKGFPAFAILA